MAIVSSWAEKIFLPTYGIGEPDKNPMFLEKRVYQGSSGKVYPYPTIDKIYDEKKLQEYTAVYLENDYLLVMILPELGGRIQRAFDKTNNYDFVYYNNVIKPALVGLTGPWISGGIEFNWPQHHRPDTYLPVDFSLKEYSDGSKSVLLNDVDRINGTKCIAEIRLYPENSFIEIRGQLYNLTPFPQTFLWWANPAVPVNDDTQSVFPPDVHAVMDHGKRDVSKFPIATGTYYKHDYSEGVDISRYKNIPVPTSYMAAKSKYDFVGGYDYAREAGLLHVADHHISPGKKQWTWGCGDFGKAWDRNLTDEDGPYIELMTGVYTDNQPDFTWMKPFEEKSFTQYFMPYKGIGYVKNATSKAAVNLETGNEEIRIRVYATSLYEQASITLYYDNQLLYSKTSRLSPVDLFDELISLKDLLPNQDPHLIAENKLSVRVTNGSETLVSYQAEVQKLEELPAPATAAEEPSSIMTTEELYLTGLHIEQYRHATYLPDSYYLEGLKRDPGDTRIGNAYGRLLLQRGRFDLAEPVLKKATERLLWKNPNPYNSEALFHLALATLMLEKEEEAFDLFYKAAWSNEQQEMSYYYLSVLSAKKGDFEKALDFVERSLIKNSHHIKARGIKAILLRKLGRLEEANSWISENLAIDAFDYVSRNEQFLYSGNPAFFSEMCLLMHHNEESYLQLARDYAEGGFYSEAIDILQAQNQTQTLSKYYEAYYQSLLGNPQGALSCLKEAESLSADYVFPNKLEDIPVLKHAISLYSKASYAYYYLGNLYYDKRQYELSKELWEQSAALNPDFPTTLRNLSLVYYNKFHNPSLAKDCLEKAYALNPNDARVFMELDQLYKKLSMTPKERLNRYRKSPSIVAQRDDLQVEYVTLLNINGDYEEALQYMNTHTFHPWEGGEGKVTTQYSITLMELAKEKFGSNEYEAALLLLKKALVYPVNLGEGKLEGTKDNHLYYYLGLTYQKLNNPSLATECFQKATEGSENPSGVMYYNDQPADMILYQGLAFQMLGKTLSAFARFHKLLDYGETSLFKEIKIEYFAVSLPDLQIFEDDLNIRNQAHCYYLIGLGNFGLHNLDLAKDNFERALTLDVSHQKSRMFLTLLEETKSL